MPKVTVTKLKQIRKSQNLTQHELAKLSGVSHQAISFIESMRRSDPQLSTALKLCRALHCSVYDLVDEEEMHNVR